MKLNEKDIKLFRDLHDTAMGNGLVDYLERQLDEICDIRNVVKGQEEVIKEVAKIIKANLIDLIKLTEKERSVTKNDFV